MITIPIIIFINVMVFIAWNFPVLGVSQQFMIDNFLVSWQALVEGRYWVLLTAAFSHNMFLHIFINMYVLKSFGGVVERTINTKRFIGFYLIASVFSSFAHAAVSAFILNDPSLPALGASGAIAGIILLFSMLYPKEKILLFAIIPMPAIFGALAFIALDIWGLTAQAGGHGLPIGHGAHLGGSFIGILYYLYLKKRYQKRMS